MTNVPLTRAIGGAIYVVASDCGLLKIGMAVDAPKRIRGLQGSCPTRLTVLAVKRSKSPVMEESDLHRRFDRYRRHGEWFDDAPAIREWLQQEFSHDQRLREIAQVGLDAAWMRGGARSPAGDREAVRARSDAFARLAA